MVTRFTKVGGGVTAHSHMRLQFRYLGNYSALTLKPHQKQTDLFRARSFIAKHGVLLVYVFIIFDILTLRRQFAMAATEDFIA